MLEEKVRKLLDEALQQRQDLFLIELIVLQDNQIRVVLDGDNGVQVDDCVFVSRAIEHNLDREETDFSLEVTSAGATTPLQNKRQYKKNIGRTLKVKTASDELKGELVEALDDSITLKWKTREPKPVGKGKVTVQKEVHVLYTDIEKATVMIKF